MDFDSNTRANQDYFVQYTCTTSEPTKQLFDIHTFWWKKKREMCVIWKGWEKENRFH